MLRFLDAGALQPRLQGNTKQDVIEELLALLQRREVITDMATRPPRSCVPARTGHVHRNAIRHRHPAWRTPAVTRLVCAVGLKREGVEFDSIDGLPAHHHPALSPLMTARLHVQFMSSISQILDENGRQQLLACRTAGEMYALLTRTEQGPARRRRRWFHRPAH